MFLINDKWKNDSGEYINLMVHGDNVAFFKRSGSDVWKKQLSSGEWEPEYILNDIVEELNNKPFISKEDEYEKFMAIYSKKETVESKQELTKNVIPENASFLDKIVNSIEKIRNDSFGVNTSDNKKNKP